MNNIETFKQLEYSFLINYKFYELPKKTSIRS